MTAAIGPAVLVHRHPLAAKAAEGASVLGLTGYAIVGIGAGCVVSLIALVFSLLVGEVIRRHEVRDAEIDAERRRRQIEWRMSMNHEVELELRARERAKERRHRAAMDEYQYWRREEARRALRKYRR